MKKDSTGTALVSTQVMQPLTSAVRTGFKGIFGNIDTGVTVISVLRDADRQFFTHVAGLPRFPKANHPWLDESQALRDALLAMQYAEDTGDLGMVRGWLETYGHLIK